MKKTLLIALISAFALFSLNAFADDKKPPTPEEMAKMMEAWQKSATPGEHHAMLGQMAGEWTFRMTMQGMGDKPMESDGTSKSEMVFDGRYLSMSADGMMMDMPFKGMGMMGFDNLKGEYQMAWIDNMGTPITVARGKPGDDPKVITLMAKMDEPMTGEKDKDVKYVWRVTDHDHHAFEAYDLVGTPQEFKAFEITYTRKK